MRTARDNFWLDTPYESGPPLSGEHEADVVIIGGGVTGMSSAYYIQQRFPDKRIIVLESEYIGFGSSGRNTGMGTTILGHNITSFKKSLGTERTAALYQLSLRSISLLDQMVEENKIDCDYEKNGLLVVAESEKEIKLLEKKAAAYEAIGTKMALFDREQARSRFTGPDVLAAYYSPDDRTLNPAKLVRGIRKAAEALGVEVSEHSHCTRIETGPMISVYTPQAHIRAANTIMATNAYSDPLGLLRHKVAPLHIYDIVTEPLNKAQLDEFNWPGRENVLGSKNIFWAARLTADNRLLFTDDSPRCYRDIDRDYSYQPMSLRKVCDFMIKKFPFLEGIKVTHRWGGGIGCTFDMLPAIGCTGKHGNIYYGMGYNGHGVAFSQVVGKMFAELMSGERTELTDHFLMNKRPWDLLSKSIMYLGANSYILYFKVLDRLLDIGR